MSTFGTVKRLIRDWHPGRRATEKKYELALADYLKLKRPKASVVRQYAVGDSRADICIDRHVFVEVKKDLNATGKLHRLLGQIDMYREHKVEKLIVVLVGSVDQRLLREVERAARQYGPGFLDDREAVVYKVPVPRRAPPDPVLIEQSLRTLTEFLEREARKPVPPAHLT